MEYQTLSAAPVGSRPQIWLYHEVAPPQNEVDEKLNEELQQLGARVTVIQDKVDKYIQGKENYLVMLQVQSITFEFGGLSEWFSVSSISCCFLLLAVPCQ